MKLSYELTSIIEEASQQVGNRTVKVVLALQCRVDDQTGHRGRSLPIFQIVIGDRFYYFHPDAAEAVHEMIGSMLDKAKKAQAGGEDLAAMRSDGGSPPPGQWKGNSGQPRRGADHRNRRGREDRRGNRED